MNADTNYNMNSQSESFMNAKVVKSTPPSPNDVASAISSETTSETHSVCEEQAVITPNATNRPNKDTKTNNSKKPSKEVEKDRPPWRTVVTAPPSKVNKNALLKAKILDATRRALLAQRISHIGTQTEDERATLLREKAIDVQTDLIEMLDKAEDTDGTVTIRKDRPGGLILTQTVGLMTEYTKCASISTQTPYPRANLLFNPLAYSPIIKGNSKYFDKRLCENMLTLRAQYEQIVNVDDKLGKPSTSNTNSNNINDQESHEIHGYTQYQQNADQRSVSSSNKTMQKNGLEQPSHQYWDSIEDSDYCDDEETMDWPKNTISDGSTPWNHLNEQAIDKRLSSMHLLPLQKRSRRLVKTLIHEPWLHQQMAVNNLVNEATVLLDVFNDVSLALGPDVKLNNIAMINNRVDFTMPISKWQPILSQSCRDLEKCLTSFKPKSHLKSASFLSNYDPQ